MLMWIVRVIFICAGTSFGFHAANLAFPDDSARKILGLVYGLIISAVLIGLEWIVSKKPLSVIFAVIFGLLIGFIMASIFSRLAVLALGPDFHATVGFESQGAFEGVLRLGLTLVCCLFGISIIYHTRDNFNFIIPYVEFKREERHVRPALLDTSVIIDGRIADICETKILDCPIIVPKFVLDELQLIADSSNRLKRNRGRRGLDILNRLQRSGVVDINIEEPKAAAAGSGDVDDRLVRMAKALDGRIITNDLNLNKSAQVQGMDVVNINDLANALKPSVMQGEEMVIRLVKAGEEPGQGVGFLDDGTMVVVDQGRSKIGKTVPIVVTNVLQTSAGRLIFGRPKGEES
ncbi:MAG: PIN/TRAM domain-containing protein [Planctomycetes bacterium]|nr:PIN/TRAM domain-containing protein [Planctomycetota bacterium]